jgi:hypothetical protein
MGKHKKDPETWKIKRNRDPNNVHITNCSEGYYKTDSRFTQIHHILPISCLADGTIEQKVKDDIKKIRKCLALTDWDINAGPNCVGLPLKRAFVDKNAPQDWDGWPCHQVDHPGYNLEVSKRLHKKVWQDCLDNMENCDDGAKTVANQLNKESKYWLDKDLRGRPTKKAWDTRFNPDGSANPLWFWPFSMNSAGPSQRKPPPDWKGFSESMVSRLSELFAKI